jgi:GTP-binding protein
MRTRAGLAEVNTRAGWTMRLHFYWVRPRGLLDAAVAGSERGAVLVDTPGYGHAVGDQSELRHWRSLIDAYVESSTSLQLGLLLIDCTRGLCDADRRVLRLLRKQQVPTLAALTKCDLLTPDELARSHAVVAAQIDEALRGGKGGGGIGSDVPLLLLSSHFYGGVERLWDELAARLRPTAAQSYEAGRGRGARTVVEGEGGGEYEVQEVAASRD